MNINDQLMQAFSILSGGLITDVSTLLVGMVTVFFIAIGFDIIKGAMIKEMRSREELKLIDEMAKQKSVYSDPSNKGTVYADIARARYRRSLNKLSDF